MAIAEHEENEGRTRRGRIDPRLEGLGWKIVPHNEARSLGGDKPTAIVEYPTENGPADYALAADQWILGMVEAKKLSLGPQNVLTQAERYSRGATQNPHQFREFRVPFLYSTNGEVIWFHDVRDPMNRSREVKDFHTPNALREFLKRDFTGACARLKALPNNHERLRPYQKEANEAVERAIADRKRKMLVAMATGGAWTLGRIAMGMLARTRPPLLGKERPFRPPPARFARLGCGAGGRECVVKTLGGQHVRTRGFVRRGIT